MFQEEDDLTLFCSSQVIELIGEIIFLVAAEFGEQQLLLRTLPFNLNQTQLREVSE